MEKQTYNKSLWPLKLDVVKRRIATQSGESSQTCNVVGYCGHPQLSEARSRRVSNHDRSGICGSLFILNAKSSSVPNRQRARPSSQSQERNGQESEVKTASARDVSAVNAAAQSLRKDSSTFQWGIQPEESAEMLAASLFAISELPPLAGVSSRGAGSALPTEAAVPNNAALALTTCASKEIFVQIFFSGSTAKGSSIWMPMSSTPRRPNASNCCAKTTPKPKEPSNAAGSNKSHTYKKRAVCLV
mmetsp:Transcript_104132/g.279730  ORF Transcript_104132/g.279730 Transcript_104132/m.279730 type:complete len:245 (-) Transcript_104132:1161-1895(-)